MSAQQPHFELRAKRITAGCKSSRSQQIIRHIIHARATGERERDVKFLRQNCEHAGNSFFATGRKPPENRSTNAHGLRTERKRAQDVSTTANATVNQHRNTPGNCINTVRQCFNSGRRAIKLTTTVV